MTCIRSTRGNEDREGEAVTISMELKAWVIMEKMAFLTEWLCCCSSMQAKLTDVVDQAKQAKHAVIAKRVLASEQR